MLLTITFETFWNSFPNYIMYKLWHFSILKVSSNLKVYLSCRNKAFVSSVFKNVLQILDLSLKLYKFKSERYFVHSTILNFTLVLDMSHPTRFCRAICNRRGSFHLIEIGTVAIHPLTLHDLFLAIVFSWDKTHSEISVIKVTTALFHIYSIFQDILK